MLKLIHTHWRSLLAGAAAATLGAAAWSLSIPPSDWKIAGPFGGSATTVAVDAESPKTVLAGGMDSLLYQSQDYGATWAILNFPRRTLGEVTSILVDGSNSNHYLVGELDAFGGGLFESFDGGKTWTEQPNFRNIGIRALASSKSDPTEFAVGTTSKGAFLSTDSGKTWKQISDPNNLEMQGISALAIDPKNPQVIYAGTSHLPWRTTDGGKTWESIHSGMIDDSDVFSIYIDPQSPSNVFASACSGIYASGNGGDAWTKIAGIPNTARRTHVVRESPDRPGMIFAGTTTGLFRSPNDGKTWKVLAETPVNGLAFDPSQPNTMYLALEYEGVGKSLDNGDSINLVNNGFVDRQIGDVTDAGKRLIAVDTVAPAGANLFASSDGGSTWSPMPRSKGLERVFLRHVAGTPDQERKLLAASSDQLYATIDGGLLWRPAQMRVVTLVTPKAPPRPAHSRTASRVRPRKPYEVLRSVSPGTINDLQTFRLNGKPVIAAATNAGLFWTDDVGLKWHRADLGASSPVLAIYASPTGSHIALKTSDAILVSADAGEHWEAAGLHMPAPDVNQIAVPDEASAPMLAATRTGLYSSADGGKSWASAGDGIQGSTTIGSVVYATPGRTAYLAEFGRVYQSDDAGSHWHPLDSSFANLPIRRLWTSAAVSNRVYAITSGLGILFRE